MAKKKGASASPFVPVEEQPYKIPENWCWVKLQYVCEFLKAGGDKPDSFVEERDKDHPVPVVANGIENDGIIGFTNVGQIAAGTVSVSGRGTIGYSILREYEYMPVVRLIVIKPLKNLLPSYLKFAFDVFEEKGTGSSIPQLTVPMVKDKFIPLPPLAEQQRIVSRIESLFSKLDEAKEKAQAVVDGFELRKSAILHKAFTGELTERWRKERGVELDGWKSQAFGLVTENLDAKRIPLSQEQRANMNRKYNYYGASGVIDKVEDYLFEGRYLLIGEDGANLVTRSKPIAFIADGQYWVNNHAHVLATNSHMIMDFLCYYINSIDLIPYVTGSAQPKLTQKKMNTIPIPVPSVQEQEQIVCILGNIFIKEQQVKDFAEAVLGQIDTMKNAILARAFRGELGTNDPAEEWAGELVKTILGR